MNVVAKVKSGDHNIPAVPRVNRDISGTRIIQCFFNVDMRCAHEGLTAVAAERGVYVDKLEVGTFVVFINTARDIIKLFAANNVVAHYKCKQGEVLELRTIPMILRSFTATGQLNYDEALKNVIEMTLERKKRVWVKKAA